MSKRIKGLYFLGMLWSMILPFLSNLYLQWCQNNLSFATAIQFAFSWHTSKFFLGVLVLWVLFLFIWSILGKLKYSSLFFVISSGLIGFADYQKMSLRSEPLYPDDLKMVVQWQMLHDIVGTPIFILCVVMIFIGLGLLVWSMYCSLRLQKKMQFVRVSTLLISGGLLGYASNFNDDTNLLRQAFNQSATWVSYSQEMNYYNVGFIGGFLYNFHVEAMEEPSGYSEEAIQKIVAKYTKLASENNQETDTEQPNIIYIQSESFSDPSRLIGVDVSGDPLSSYKKLASKSFSGQMLSQNYGGGTANIEFEALTSFSMELLTSQMTTPYTMLVPKLSNLPSLVSFLKKQNYQTTAIHPYATSMYKRTDVYSVLGFDDFLDEEDIEEPTKIENNPYISDEAVYNQIIDTLDTSEQAQFIHFVTMQTHMPYGNKYDETEYAVSGTGNSITANDYAQDIAYSSQSLSAFVSELAKLDRPTIVVFWGDHLPSIYSDSTKAANSAVTLHLTEYLMYSTAQDWSTDTTNTLSPYYFAPTLLKKAQLPISGFYELLSQVEAFLPASEKGRSYYQGTWQQLAELTEEEQEIYHDYELIQYDQLQGKQYSTSAFFQVAP